VAVFIAIGQYVLACVLLPAEVLSVSVKYEPVVTISVPAMNSGKHSPRRGVLFEARSFTAGRHITEGLLCSDKV
jgi:hypothetical protein